MNLKTWDSKKKKVWHCWKLTTHESFMNNGIR